MIRPFSSDWKKIKTEEKMQKNKTVIKLLCLLWPGIMLQVRVYSSVSLKTCSFKIGRINSSRVV